MPTRFRISALGHPIDLELTAGSRADVAVFRAAWSRLAVPEPPTELIVATGAESPVLVVAAEDSSPRVVERFVQRVTLAAIEAGRGELFMLHAGAVALPDGTTVVFVGPSGRGKTTASIALGRRFGYVSDETVGIAEDLSIAAYPKPLSIVGTDPVKAQVSPDDLGLLVAPVPLRLGAIVLLDRSEDGPEIPELSSVGLADAVAELVPQSSSLAVLDGGLLRVAATVAAVGGIRRVRYREASALASVVERLLQTTVEPVEQWVAVEGRPNAIENGENVLVLRDGVVRVLGGIGATIWLTEAAGGDVRSRVIELHGAPPSGDATTLIAAATAELRAAGL